MPPPISQTIDDASSATARRDHRQTDPWGARIRQGRLGAAPILPDESPEPSGEAQEVRVLGAVLSSAGAAQVDGAIHESSDRFVTRQMGRRGLRQATRPGRRAVCLPDGK